MNRHDQNRFDQLLEAVIGSLPPALRSMVDQIGIVVMDRPTPAMIEELRADGTMLPEDAPEDICGLHTGVMFTEESVEDSGSLPSQIHLFRDGIVSLAGGWENGDSNVQEEIRITLLHEIGHQFGLDEDDLERLGYD